MIQVEKIETKIISVIDRIRPFLLSEGGDIKFLEYKDGTVYVKLIGACSNCIYMDSTLKDGIEIALINEIPEVIEVVNIDS